jgi:DNA-binding transcriptional ArsR family regulator
MSTETITAAPTALDILWAVHNPTQKQRHLLRLLPTTANAVLVTLASAGVLAERDPSITPVKGSVLLYPAFIARTLGLSEPTIKGHLKSLSEAGLVTGRATALGPVYAANGPVILANIAQWKKHTI